MMKKILRYFLVGILVLFLMLFLVRNFVLKAGIEHGVKLVTGLDFRMGQFDAAVLRPVVTIRDLRILNPHDFPDKVMLHIAEIYAVYDLPALLSGKFHFQELRFHLREFVVVRNKYDKLNLDSLVAAQKKLSSGPQQPMPQIQIDLFLLKIDKVVYRDYHQGDPPVVKEFAVNVTEQFKDIKSPLDLARLVVMRALQRTAVAALTNFDLNNIRGALPLYLASPDGFAGELKSKVTQFLDNASRGMKNLFNK